MENSIISIDNIENMIYEVRGVQVMLDSDLAKLYHVETKRINEAVKNNPDKFPNRYSFILDGAELDFSRSKISTLNVGKGRGHILSTIHEHLQNKDYICWQQY